MYKIKQNSQINFQFIQNNPIQNQESFESFKILSSNQPLQLSNSYIINQQLNSTQKQNIKISDHKQSNTNNKFTFKNNNFSTQQSIQSNMATQCHPELDILEICHAHQNSFQKQNNFYTQKNQIPSNNPGLNHNKLIQPHQRQTFQSIDQESSVTTNPKSAKKKDILQNIILNHKQQMSLGSKVISGLQKNIVSLPFRQPVDIIGLNIPDYLQVIQQPMDLRTIKKRLNQDYYENINQIYSDIQLIISNSYRYNELNCDFIRLTKNFQKSYNKIRRDCQRNMRKNKTQEEKKIVSFEKRPIYQKSRKNLKQQKIVCQTDIVSSFEFADLSRLAKKIRKLLPEQQIQIFRRIGIKDTMTIDIKTLHTKQVRNLMKDVDKILQERQTMVQNEQKKQNSNMTACDQTIK